MVGHVIINWKQETRPCELISQDLVMYPESKGSVSHPEKEQLWGKTFWGGGGGGGEEEASISPNSQASPKIDTPNSVCTNFPT